MSISSIMRTSASGMSVQADRMGAIADNVANVATTGYKGASVEFSTLMPESNVLEYTPGSVETHVRRAITSQGNFAFTQSATDLAIKGDGFFLVTDSADGSYLTRAGSFVPNGEGDFVNAAGYKLLGLDLSAGNATVTANSTAELDVVNISQMALIADPSRAGALQVNVPSNAAAILPAALPSTNAATAAYTAKTSIVAYDNLGNGSTLDIYFADTGAGVWEVAAFDRASASAAGGFPYAGGPLTTLSLTFDSTTGAISGGAATLAIPVPNGQTLALDLAGTTQLAADFSVRAVSVDGRAPADVERIEISGEGTLTAIYENGARVDRFRIPLGRTSSDNNLVSLTGNVFAVSRDSGALQIGFAGAGGFGSVVSSALEQSTVDLAAELTEMIESQRNYTANSRVFQTGSELMDVLVNLRR
jgi:flagellar hook protein FlgE